MSVLLDVQEENDFVWTLVEGALTAWQVRVNAVKALLDEGIALPEEIE